MTYSTAIILGFGKSERFGNKNKLLENIAGKSLIQHTLLPFVQTPEIQKILLITSIPPKAILSSQIPEEKILFLQGGKERQDSVAQGLKSLPNQTEIVLIHDAARPLVQPHQIRECIEKAKIYKSSTLARKVTETIKFAEGNLSEQTLDREKIWIIETPQAFEVQTLKKAYQERNEEIFPDETSIVERIGIPTYLIENSLPNPKITHPQDFQILKSLLNS